MPMPQFALGFALALAAAAIAAPAQAHHGWSSYDAATVLAFEAPILVARYQNPHGEVEIEAEGQRWLVTLAPPGRMAQRGLSEEMLAVGTVVAVEGYPSRTGAPEMRAERITVNGQTVEMRR